MNEMRERLMQLLSRYFDIGDSYTYNLTRAKSAFAVGTVDLDDFEEYTEDDVADLADYLLDNGVIVTPCVAMVEQFIKNGEFDKKLTAHNGKYAVVYMDKAKWICPLIDITEQSYNAEKAKERIQALKARENECTEE